MFETAVPNLFMLLSIRILVLTIKGPVYLDASITQSTVSTKYSNLVARRSTVYHTMKKVPVLRVQ